MAVRISTAIARVVCDTINSAIDAEVDPGTLKIYSGSRPASVDTAITSQVALVTFDLPDPAFGAAVNAGGGGTATANPIDPVQADNTGTASFFRVFDGNGVAIFDGSVTDTAGNGDLKLSSTAVVAGIDVTVVSLTTTMPTGV